MRPGICDEFGQFDLKCSVKLITAPSNAQLFRMLASFQTHVNIVSDTVCRSLKLDKKPYHGEPISVLGRGDRIPTGTVELQWGFSRGEKLYRDVFHVVEGVGYDLLLKMPSKK
ncbi:hypothetical protein ASPCADRAFT_55014 [Aspergillus carbonarius ITEM 5010]|uniref:Uncharacterized protein n=1 Tax=Aspergillus carbonarius (strain ITEM 5010) TaxID=602072 RepID=A0A1R3RDN1_ASPC5|nr:hypothetical protein ASPCADRAFT_55014 [Aspergillus carbonarius ITEM 5010]